MAKILGLPFDSYVDKQVNIRQAKLAKTQKDPEDLTVFNSNTAWVRLTSGVKIEPDRAKTLSVRLGVTEAQILGTSLSRNLVLWGGVSGFTPSNSGVTLDDRPGGVGYGLNNAYGFLTTPDQGLKPLPGITNISNSYKNNGSLRQAQVHIKCYSRSQFEALEAVYLRLGYTLILEWGNSTWFDNQGNLQQTNAYSIPNILFRDEKNIDPEEVRARLLKNKQDTACNYDGMLAKVANYSWTLNEDLSFDIRLDLISVGDIIDSLKANLGGSASTATIQVETSGSIQNLVNIVINKEVSKVNKLFYEMYDEVFKDLLQKYGSLENQKIVQQLDNVEETAPLIKEIQNKYNSYLFEKLYKPYVLVKEAFDIYTNEPDLQKFKANPRTTELTQQLELRNNIALYYVLTAEGNIADILTDYKTKVDTLQNFITKLKPETGQEGKDLLIYLNNSTDPFRDLVRALGTGYLGPDEKYKVEGAKFKDTSANYLFYSILRDHLFIEQNFGQ